MMKRLDGMFARVELALVHMVLVVKRCFGGQG